MLTMRKYQVAVSGEAQRMLKDHVFFLATVNPDAAERLRKTIVEQIRGLETMPERHPYLEPDDRRNPYRKMVVQKRYIVIYMVVADTVYVEYVVDGRQDYQWLLNT